MPKAPFTTQAQDRSRKHLLIPDRNPFGTLTDNLLRRVAAREGTSRVTRRAIAHGLVVQHVTYCIDAACPRARVDALVPDAV